MKGLYLIIVFNLLSSFIFCQTDTIKLPVDELINKLKTKDTTKVENDRGINLKDSKELKDFRDTNRLYLESIVANTLLGQLYLIKDISKESKSLKSSTTTHIANLYIGGLVDNKIIMPKGIEQSSKNSKRGSNSKSGSIVVEHYETGEKLEWKNPVLSENYLSIANFKNKSAIALGDSTLNTGFYAVASIKDSANVDIQIEFYPTLESCQSAVVRNANGVVFSIIPDKGSLKTYVVGFIEPNASPESRISFFKQKRKNKKS